MSPQVYCNYVNTTLPSNHEIFKINLWESANMLTPIKELRLKNKLRQADIEKLTSIPQPRYSRLERGEAEPTKEEKEALAKAFGLVD